MTQVLWPLSDMLDALILLWFGVRMLGPIASSVMTIMRLMTPKQVKQLVENANKKDRGKKVEKIQGAKQSSASGVDSNSRDGEICAGQAKIIPLHQEQEDPPSEQQQESKEERHQSLVSPQQAEHEFIKEDWSLKEEVSSVEVAQAATSLEAIGVLSAEKQRVIASKKRQELNSKKPSSSTFLLEQRDRLKESNKKIICSEGYKSYQDRLKEKRSAKSSIMDESSGVLVDKKLA